MALTTCGECGGKVSDQAATCPHCGAPVARSQSMLPPPSAASSSPPTTVKKGGDSGAGWIFLALLVVAGLVGIAMASTPDAHPTVSTAADSAAEVARFRRQREPSYIRQEQDKIKQRLRDPESAQFRNVAVYYAVTPMVCGEVNAKNALGGYTGFTRFISAGELQVLESDMAAGEMTKTWNQVCR